jgi:hypothetical protein
MSLILLMLGIGLLAAFAFDASSDAPDTEDDAVTEDTPRQIMGSEEADLISSLVSTPTDWATASPDEVNDRHPDPFEIHAGAGDDTLVGGNGDTLWGGEGNDTFVYSYDPTSTLPPSTIFDFEKGSDTVLLRMGGAPLNAFSDDPSFDLSNLVSVEQSAERTEIEVDSQTALVFASALELNVKWSWGEPDLRGQYQDQNDIRNLDGSVYTGNTNEIDIIVTRQARFSS